MNQLTLRTRKKLVWLCILSVSLQILAPIPAYALTSGPNQPEFSSFEPVATTSMVNEFTGDFTYNLPVIEIPGPEGSGYALSLSYYSGTSPEEEASWVGYGWTLNPGAILRNKQGFPDDFKGEEVTYHNDVPNNWTVTFGGHGGNLEGFSADVPLNANAAIRYNNYKGFGYVAGLGLSVKGIVSLGYNISDGEGSFSFSVNPAAILADRKHQAKEDLIVNEALKEKDAQKRRRYSDYTKNKLGKVDFLGSEYGVFSKNWVSRPTNTSSYQGLSINVTGSMQSDPGPVPVGPEVGFFGSYTQQVAESEKQLDAYGYMYSGYANDTSITDYYLEKESPYHKRDKFLAIPFSNPDHFTVSGEGLGGGFRMHHKRAGHFFPNSETSFTSIANIGLELQAGATIGVGTDVSIPSVDGAHELSVSSWGGYDENYTFATDEDNLDEPVFFRFKNDLGGNISYGTTDPPEVAGVNDDQAPDLSSLDFGASFQANGYNATQFHGRSGRSSYIGYHTNKEINLSTPEDIHYSSYTKDAAALALVDREDPSIENGIGEIITTNEDGYTYTFGLPVYARNEATLQYGFKNIEEGDIEGGLIVHRDIEDESNIRFKVGEERETPYATSFLLTSITSPDYIDRQLDGPTRDDFGAYTRFVYDQHYGDPTKSNLSDNWYRWRIPYTGFLYNRNSLSDQKDDACSVAYGEKEVYYLDTIETKTHFAVFYTSLRADGMGAVAESIAAGNDNPTVTDHLLRLDSITLHARNPEDGSINPQWLQRVNFAYTYDLMPGLPNSSDPNGQGKLTLKRVWTDYNGIVEAKIAPYEFEYAYPDVLYPEPYNVWDNYPYSTQAQNPPYDPVNLDTWGNYQANGAERYTNMRPWVDQRGNPDFDPAAWQLKVIRLPSGGEIHVQYEQKEYQYVQDRRAMAMVRLMENPVFDDLNNPDVDIDVGNKYYLDLSDLGMNPSDEDYVEKLEKLVTLIRKEFVEKDEKIYFKFLYALTGFSPDLGVCNSEFIQGYARVNKVLNIGFDDELNGDDELRLFVKLGTLNPLDEFSHPRRICRDYVQTNRGRIQGGDCDAEDGINTNTGPVEVVNQLLNFVGITFSGAQINCLTLDESRSYIRIPVLKPKKGGGVRVKRLLMYDQSLGERVLYGNEYIYETIDEIGDTVSTGVALNEPAKIQEENTLITNLEKRTDQGFFEKVFAGKYEEQFRGPVGASILPGASIGYSKVIVKNIHSGRTSPGFTVKEFYTAKDYPFDGYYPVLGQRGVEMTEINEGDKEWLMIPAGLFNYFKSNLWLTQGFSFIQNDFHGKPRRIATYSGPHADIHNPAVVAKTSEQYYEYFEPGENIPVSMGLDNSQVSYEDLGKETEVIFETRKIEDVAVDQNVEGDFSMGLLPVPPTYLTAWPSYTYRESKLHTHVTVKVTSYPAIVKGVRNYQDGMYTYTKNLRFSRENGRPILTRTTDGYHGLDLEESSMHQGYYTTYQYAAADIYPALGQRAFNEQRRVEDATYNSTFKYFDLTTPETANLFALGDFISVSDGTDVKLFHVKAIQNNRVYLYEHSSTSEVTLDTNEENESEVTVEVLISGHLNRLNENAGNLIVYGQENITVNTEYEADNEAFIEFLNDLLQSNVTGEFSFNGVIGINEDGNCVPYDEVNIVAGLNGDGGGYFSIQNNGTINKACDLAFQRSEVCPEEDYFELEGNSIIFNRCTGDGFIENNLSKRCLCDPGPTQTIPGFVDVNISTYSDDWSLPSALHPVFDLPQNASAYSPYETGARGKWRPNANYVYREGIIPGVDEPGADTDNRVYKQAGTFTMEVFDWDNLAANDPDKWIQVNRTTLYSPHGQALEEENIQGIKSVAKYGYNHTMPYLVAQNAEYSSVYFESFENDYSNNEDYAFNLEDGASYSPPDTIDDRKAHAGTHSLRLEVIFKDGLLASSYAPKSFRVNEQIKDNGVKFQVWVKTRDRASQAINTFTLTLDGFTSDQTVDFLQIARSGEWVLYEAKVLPESFVPYSAGEVLYPKLHFDLVLQHLQYEIQGTQYVNIQDEIWIDDLRYQPLDAQMNCFVYDPTTYRLLTSFDDQHFGLFYQYNAQGQLVRKMVETERGLKTVQETQYHTPLTQMRNQE